MFRVPDVLSLKFGRSSFFENMHFFLTQSFSLHLVGASMTFFLITEDSVINPFCIGSNRSDPVYYYWIYVVRQNRITIIRH